jgi:hypothetical protein
MAREGRTDRTGVAISTFDTRSVSWAFVLHPNPLAGFETGTLACRRVNGTTTVLRSIAWLPRNRTGHYGTAYACQFPRRQVYVYGVMGGLSINVLFARHSASVPAWPQR